MAAGGETRYKICISLLNEEIYKEKFVVNASKVTLPCHYLDQPLNLLAIAQPDSNQTILSNAPQWAEISILKGCGSVRYAKISSFFVSALKATLHVIIY